MGYFKEILTESYYRSRTKVLTNILPKIDIEAGAVEKYHVDTEKFNSDVALWYKAVSEIIKTSIRGLSKKGKGELVKSLRVKTRKDKYYGTIERISFLFERHGVFWHKGVGRGYAASGTTVIRKSSGNSRVITSQSLNRQPVEWFNPVIENNIEQLASIVSMHMANAAVNATRMKIN